MTPYQVGYCVCCGDQSLIKDRYGRPVAGMPGTTMAWLCLCTAEGEVKTRVGYISFCKDCPLEEINDQDLQEIKQGLFEGNSGVDANCYEFKVLPKMKLELISQFDKE